MRILITRPRADAEALKSTLEAKGHAALIAPMLTIEERPVAVDLGGVQALLFTSANGVRAFAAAETERRVPAWCVGAATAAAAHDAGFADVHESGGDAEHLAADIIARLAPDDGALLHIAGTVTKAELGAALSEAGFDYRRAVLYAAQPVRNLPKAVKDALAVGRVDAVLLFSPRTARLFQDAVSDVGQESDLAPVAAYCLSPAVAQTLDRTLWGAICVAETPEQSAMFRLIDSAL